MNEPSPTIYFHTYSSMGLETVCTDLLSSPFVAPYQTQSLQNDLATPSGSPDISELSQSSTSSSLKLEREDKIGSILESFLIAVKKNNRQQTSGCGLNHVIPCTGKFFGSYLISQPFGIFFFPLLYSSSSRAKYLLYPKNRFTIPHPNTPGLRLS